jgi:hypothetical protein
VAVPKGQTTRELFNCSYSVFMIGFLALQFRWHGRPISLETGLGLKAAETIGLVE